jgi:hypothetical protein
MNSTSSAASEVYISDRSSKPVKTSIEDLQKARGSRFPPFPPKHKLLKIEHAQKTPHFQEGVIESIKNCYTSMLKPPIKNIGLAGCKNGQNWL